MKVADISFYNDISGISAGDYRYWKSHFDKILKLGVELEFNLNIKKGNCDGFKTSCVCDNYTECSPIPCCFSSEGKCTVYYKHSSQCAHFDSEECSGVCHKCAHAENIDCNSMNCVSYQPLCLDCANNTVDCNACDDYVNNKVDPSIVRRNLSNILEATENFGFVGKNGVLQVVGDGSLVNRGLEIPTVGRRYDFDVFRDMLDTIITKAVDIGGYIDSRCSIHVHVLNEYYTKTSNDRGRNRQPDQNAHMNITGLEKKFPNIILFNMLQIWRRYEIALFWMSMGLADAESMTRWTKFRLPILPFNPIQGLDHLLSFISEHVGNSRYGSINIKNSLFDGKRFHVEMRVMDFVKSPTYISAMCALFRAIVMRAIDISVFGIMNIDDNMDIESEHKLLKYIANGHDKGYDSSRLSATARVLDRKDTFIRNSHEMLDFMAPCIGANTSEMKVLRAIADKPPALHLIGATCSDPQNNFDMESVYAKYVEDKTDAMRDYIYSIIALGNINNCSSENDWISEVYEEYANNKINSKEQLSKHVNSLVKQGLIVWDYTLNAYKQSI